MATNTFKRLTKENINNNSGSPSTIYTAATNKTSIVIGCLLCNKLSSQVTASVYIDTAISGNDDVFLVKDLVIPANTSTELVLGKVIMTHDNTNGDVLKAYSNTASAIDILASVLEDVN